MARPSRSTALPSLQGALGFMRRELSAPRGVIRGHTARLGARAQTARAPGLPLGQTLGKKVLKPRMSSLWPLNSFLTRMMTPCVSILRRRPTARTARRFGRAKKHKRGKRRAAAVRPVRSQGRCCAGLFLCSCAPGAPSSAVGARRRQPVAGRQHSAFPRAPLGLELLHDVQEGVIHLLAVGEAVLDLRRRGQ